MTTIRKIVTSKIDGNSANENDTNEIRPFGETAFYLDTSGPTDRLTLMMFDGMRTHQRSKVLKPGVLYGSNADSGDGASLDTIKLIPDAALHFNDGNFGNDQYLIVDPTAPNHIHLRAGGTIDNSNSVLYVGGETSHLRVDAGLNPPVYISSNNQTWGFDGSGTLTFPAGDSYQAGLYLPPIDTDFVINSRSRALAFANAVTGSGQDTFVADISTNDDIIVVQPFWTVDVGGTIYSVSSIAIVGGVSCTITVPGALFVEGQQYIFRSDTLTGAVWNFGTTGVLTTPGLGTITHQNNDLKLEVSGTDVIVLRTAGGELIFNANGSLTFPSGAGFAQGDPGQLKTNDGTTLALDFRDTSGRGFYTNGDGFSLRGNGSNTWKFDTTGSVTFPDNTVQTTAWSGGRVVAVPANSYGAVGDQQGDLAFANGYLYYCTQNYVGSSTNVTTLASTGTFVYVSSADYAGDLVADFTANPTGWTYNGVTIISVAVDNGFGPGYLLEAVTSFGVINENDYALVNPNTLPNIWKRVAWSADTW